MADRTAPKTPTVNGPEHTVLNHLSKQDLIQHVQDLQEELRMSRAFSQIGENSATDATLLWQGRNRFLAEKIIPVRLHLIGTDHLALHPVAIGLR